MYAQLYAIERMIFKRVKISMGLLSVPLLLLTSLDFLFCRVEYLKDPDTGVETEVKVRVIFSNFESEQKYHEM